MDTYARISTPDRMEELQAQNERLQSERSGFEETIAALNTEIADEKLGNKTLVTRITNLQSYIDSMIERLMEFVEQDEIDNDVAQELASFFGRDLVRTVTVRVTADIDVEVTIPVGYDIDDLHGDLEVEISNTYSSDVEVQNFETQGIQVEEM
jgi:sugar-specific transcriptional regulator TrmB